MLISHIKIAFRVFKQHKLYSLLNVFGLSIGLAAALLVALFANNELSYDEQHPDAERVYRIAQNYTELGLGVIPIFNYIRGTHMLEYSQVEGVFALKLVELTGEGIVDIKYGDQGFKLNKLYSATPNIEDFVSLVTLSGDLQNAMSVPNGLAISESEAKRIFGHLNVIGKTLTHKEGQYTVKAVFADLPENTHFGFKNLIYADNDPADIHRTASHVYLKLAPETDISALEHTLSEQFFDGEFKGKLFLELHPLLELHLTAKSAFEMKAGGAKQVVLICIGLSLLLVLIASFNFINMTVAQSAKRAKEVGVRKALGANKTQLVIQFLSESVLVTVFSTLLACALVELLLPSFNNLVTRELSIDYSLWFTPMMFGVALLVGILAGLYPACFISSFSAKRVLNGDLQRGSTAILVRKSLLTLQGALSIGLIIVSMSLYQQLKYLQNLPLGYETEQRLVISDIPVSYAFNKEPSALIRRLSTLEGVSNVSVIDTQLTRSINSTLEATWPNGEKSEGLTPIIGSHFNLVKGLGLKLIAGRDFSFEYAGDWAVRENGMTQAGAIVTETIAKQAGYKNSADIIGKTIKDTTNNIEAKVVGVVADVKVGNSNEANSNILFLCGFNFRAQTSEIILTLNTHKLVHIREQVIEILAQTAHVFEPNINLLTENYQAGLQADKRISKVVLIFTSLAVFLTCLGTFGLASFSAARRQKEMAVRKVLGASRISIVNILAKEFLMLVGVSIAIAYPVTYLLVGDWLANFNDRIDQVMWVYGVAAMAVAVITWVTVAALSFKVASTRPSLILRYE